MFLARMFGAKAPVIEARPVQTGTVSFEWVVTDPVSSHGLATVLDAAEGVARAAHESSPPEPPIDPQQCAAMRSDVQRSETLADLLGYDPAPLNDATSHNREERALRILRGKPGWFKHNDKQLAVLFECHSSTVSRWRKKWVAAGLVEVKQDRRRKWMRAV